MILWTSLVFVDTEGIGKARSFIPFRSDIHKFIIIHIALIVLPL